MQRSFAKYVKEHKERKERIVLLQKNAKERRTLKGNFIFFPASFFLHIHTLLQCYYMLCWVYSPSWARTWVLSVGVGFSSSSWHIFPESGPFVVHHHPIRDPAVNLCLFSLQSIYCLLEHIFYVQ